MDKVESFIVVYLLQARIVCILDRYQVKCIDFMELMSN